MTITRTEAELARRGWGVAFRQVFRHPACMRSYSPVLTMQAGDKDDTINFFFLKIVPDIEAFFLWCTVLRNKRVFRHRKENWNFVSSSRADGHTHKKAPTQPGKETKKTLGINVRQMSNFERINVRQLS